MSLLSTYGTDGPRRGVGEGERGDDGNCRVRLVPGVWRELARGVFCSFELNFVGLRWPSLANVVMSVFGTSEKAL